MTMTDGLYHAEIGLPEGYRHPSGLVNIDYSAHARKAAGDDRYGYIPLPAAISLSRYKTVEVEILNGKVRKIVIRGALLMDIAERDVIFVLMPRAGKPWFCKTVWANLKSDSHKTLDRSRYVG